MHFYSGPPMHLRSGVDSVKNNGQLSGDSDTSFLEANLFGKSHDVAA
jgi:hypothetical protein